MMFPLASGHSNVCILFVPREESGESKGAVRLHRTSQYIKLCSSGARKGISTTKVDEEPLLEEVLGVIRQQRPLADKFNPALNFKFWLSHGQATTMKFGYHSYREEKKRNELSGLEN